MTAVAERSVSWTEWNQQALSAELARLAARLRANVPGLADEPPAVIDTPAESGFETALDLLVATFGLSPFERDVVLMCAGVELQGDFARLCTAANGGRGPSFGLALQLENAHWSALSPAAPLQYWRLVERGPSESLVQAPLRIDERILSFLAGIDHLDERLQGYVQPVAAPPYLAVSQRLVALRLARSWLDREPHCQLVGRPSSCEDVAAAAAQEAALKLYRLSVGDIPVGAVERNGLLRLWQREAALGNAALLIDCGQTLENDAAVAAFVAALDAPVVVAGELRSQPAKALTRLDLRPVEVAESREAWSLALAEARIEANHAVEAATEHFCFGYREAAAAAHAARATTALTGATAGEALWAACVDQARPRLEHLAHRIVPRAGWQNLVLPDLQRGMLRDITRQVRHRRRVYEDWGFGERSGRGLGITALFAGESGTGKTLAAEVIAGDLGLDLFRIDLASVVSKYIGETEKNLKQVFDAAEDGGAVLLFDEADALFGSRSEVRDSHDRYANIEVSYLLQRMEAFQGLAILTSNMKDALDKAFVRRLRFIVSFPFPDTAQRTEIWGSVFPKEMPRGSIAVEKLARLTLSGGNIRNIALSAAFLAADAGEPVAMTHLLRAARNEFAKLERSLSEADVRDWL